jgi:hypothetical protein
MTRRLMAVLSVWAAVLVLAVQAQDRLPVKVDPKKKSDVKRSEDSTDPKTKEFRRFPAKAGGPGPASGKQHQAGRPR